MNNFVFTMAQASAADPNAAAGGAMSILTLIVPLVLMVLIFWLLIIRPEKKRTKEMQNMLSNLQIADEIVTNGGIVGLVVSVSNDTVLIETGSNRTTIRIMKSAIAKCNTQHETVSSSPDETVKAKSSKGKTEIK